MPMDSSPLLSTFAPVCPVNSPGLFFDSAHMDICFCASYMLLRASGSLGLSFSLFMAARRWLTMVPMSAAGAAGSSKTLSEVPPPLVPGVGSAEEAEEEEEEGRGGGTAPVRAGMGTWTRARDESVDGFSSFSGFFVFSGSSSFVFSSVRGSGSFWPPNMRTPRGFLLFHSSALVGSGVFSFSSSSSSSSFFTSSSLASSNFRFVAASGTEAVESPTSSSSLSTSGSSFFSSSFFSSISMAGRSDSFIRCAFPLETGNSSIRWLLAAALAAGVRRSSPMPAFPIPPGTTPELRENGPGTGRSTTAKGWW